MVIVNEIHKNKTNLSNQSIYNFAANTKILDVKRKMMFQKIFRVYFFTTPFHD